MQPQTKPNKMKVEVKQIDSTIAKGLLLKNTNNRSFNRQTVYNYSNMMKNGLWKANGESIIIDKNGVVKDGQHRMMAIIQSETIHTMVLVTDVNPDVMDTIDTGRNRNLRDILKLEGFASSAIKASHIKSMIKIDRGIDNIYNRHGGNTGSVKFYVSNSEGLEYGLQNKQNLDQFTKEVNKVYDKSKKIMPQKLLGKVLYLLAGFEYKDIHIEFIKSLAGLIYQQGTAASYVYDSVYKAKQSKSPLTEMWIIKATIKAWNIYVNGNPEIKYIKVTSNIIDKPIKL